ncbi:YggT family protein [Nocardia sp. NPDC004860]|uniref:YggT family protein n=1 Tax=Nocardia sp. NPDC004860 TaxID=3154557 RepID=UPI0033AFD51C
MVDDEGTFGGVAALITLRAATTKEFAMSFLGSLLGLALTLFMLLLLARLIIDWIGVLGDTPPALRKARDVVHRLTEPVIAPVRRVLKPVRFGGVSIDLAFTVVFIAVLVLRAIAFNL